MPKDRQRPQNFLFGQSGISRCCLSASSSYAISGLSGNVDRQFESRNLLEKWGTEWGTKWEQNRVRFSEGEARRRHQPPWRSVSETSARKLKQRSHRPELKAQAAFSLKGRCRRMRQRVGKENAPALRARISTDKKMAPSIAGRPFSYLWRWAESNRRPNNVPGGFLHAYPAFGCRPRNAGRRAVRGLSPGS